MESSIVSDNEEREILVREGFHILTQGAEMVHYEVHNMGLRTTYANSTKILWLNPDSLRLCITKNRPPISDERLYPGVYLRDVAEVVGGDHTFAFATHPEKPNSQEQCLNIIASERTLCLQLPSEFSRNWFLERLRLLCDDILTTNEKNLRDSIKWTKMSNRLPFQDFHREIAESTQSLLEKGVDVKFHTNGGKIHDCTLFYDPDQRRLEVKKTTGFFKFVFQTRGINLSDIYSLRPGTHSFGFVQAKSENEKQENCMSIIGSECTIDVELPSQRARDVLMHKLKVLADFMYYSNQDAV